MKKILLLFLTFFISSVSNADVKGQAISKASDKISEYTIGLIPGDGHTEFNFNLREHSSPQFSILGVREIHESNGTNLFTQFSAFNHERFNTGSHGNGNEEITVNLGLGARKLFNDNTLILGVNNFYDFDVFNTHERLSVGFEAKSAVLDFTANKYIGMNTSGYEELVLGGHDYKIRSQIPYLHWAKISATGYTWEGQSGRADLKGYKYGTDLQLTRTIIFDVAYDDKDKDGLEDEYEANLKFVWPPVNSATALDGIAKTAWNENKDMTDQLLSKVQRNNKIVVQFVGSATISRAN